MWWLLLLLLLPVLRPMLKLAGALLLLWLVLSLVQMAVALPVAGWEAATGSPVPPALYHGFCFLLLASVLFLYFRRRAQFKIGTMDRGGSLPSALRSTECGSRRRLVRHQRRTRSQRTFGAR